MINATGGYKAQISFASLIGQALEIPVLYMFERFPEIITLPPQPLSFNFDLWFRYFEELQKLCKENTVPLHEIRKIYNDEKMKPLLDEERIDNEIALTFNPMGELFFETLKYRFNKDKKNYLPRPLEDGERIPPKFSTHFDHTPPRFAEDLINKIWNEKKYIKTIRDFYVNPDLPEKSRFGIDKSKGCLELIYSDGTKTAKFRIELSESQEKNLIAAFEDLESTFSF